MEILGEIEKHTLSERLHMAQSYHMGSH